MTAIICSAARAEGLPVAAKPMGSEAVKKIYSGNSEITKDADLYFAPDGSVKGIFGKPKSNALIEGSWSVSGNEICIYTFKGKERNSFRDCYQYWIDGKRVIVLWSIHSDGSTVDQINGYHVGEEKNFKPGDVVSDKYDATTGK
jgi:hypothetical protein